MDQLSRRYLVRSGPGHADHLDVAGTSSKFKASAFRAAIRSVMDLGAPPVGGDQLKFYWNPVVAATPANAAVVIDGEGVPFSPGDVIARVVVAPVTRACAVEYVDSADVPTVFGAVLPSRVKVTLLDEDYVVVASADYVVVGGDKYLRHHEPPSYGLYEVGVHQIVFAAENEL